MKSFKITPSIYTTNTLALYSEIEKLIAAGIDQLHFDVMDGHYVNNYGFGTKQFQEINKAFPNLKVDVHLMANNISPLLKEFKQATYLTFHYQSKQLENFETLISLIHHNGNKVGIAMDLETTLEQVLPFLNQIELLTIMSIKPGFTGQKFEIATWKKISEIKTYLTTNNLPVKIQIDGGVRWENLKQLIECGIDYIVVGSLMFSEVNYLEVMNKIKKYHY